MKRKDHPNYYRFLHPPTIEQIDAVVSKLDVSEPHFEAYHGLYNGCIAHVRMGFRKLPLKYWHLFLDPLPNSTNKRISKPIQKIAHTRKSSKTTKALSSMFGD